MKKNTQNIFIRNDAGFTIFIAVMVSALMLIVVLSISSIAYKETILSGAGRDSELAFYAADSGIECALFWDYRNPGHDHSAFLSPVQIITCGSSAVTYQSPGPVGGVGLTTGFDPGNPDAPNKPSINDPAESAFTVSFLNGTCAKVYVSKYYDINDEIKTVIESKGQTDCGNPNNPRRFERAIRVVDFQ